MTFVTCVTCDIQGAEAELLPPLLPLLRAKVHRLIIATHGNQTHAELRRLFGASLDEWSISWDVPWQENTACMESYVRGYQKGGRKRFDWDALLAEGCYTNTSRGPVAQADGELIVENRRLVRDDQLFDESASVAPPWGTPHLFEGD